MYFLRVGMYVWAPPQSEKPGSGTEVVQHRRCVGQCRDVSWTVMFHHHWVMPELTTIHSYGPKYQL